MVNAASIGAKYGQAINDFTTASENAVEDVLLAHCNEGIRLMSKRIQSKTRTGGASTLAQSMNARPVEKVGSISVITFTTEDYWKYLNYGVNGVKKNKGAVKSIDGVVYKFKNLGVPPKMLDSFMSWASRAKIRSIKGTTLSYKGKKRTKAITDHKKVAKQLAVMTKIGGIKPVKFVEVANNSRRNKQLATDLKAAMGQVIRINIKKF